MARVMLKTEVVKSSISGDVRLIRETWRNDYYPPGEDIYYQYTLECPLGSFMAGQDEEQAIEIFEDNYRAFYS